MRIDYVEGDEYWTVESLADLAAWEILWNEPWTEAVSRLHCRNSTNPREFRVFYCKNSILNEVQKVETVQ